MIESKWYRLASKLSDMMIMGFLWTVFSLPIITIGAATTAVFYTATKKVTGKDDEYISTAFIKSFKENFFKSTIIFVLLIIVAAISSLNYILAPYISLGLFHNTVRIVSAFILLQAIGIATFSFAYIARFNVTLKEVIKNSFILANKHLLITLSNLALFLATFYLVVLVPFLLLFMMGIYAYFASFSIVKVFRKYNPDFDEFHEMADEDFVIDND